MSTSTHTITLQPGEAFTLPPNATLVFVSDPDSISTDCVDVPETTYVCGYFAYVRDDDDNDGHPFDESHLVISKVYVGDSVYTLDVPGGNPTAIQLNTNIPDQAVFSFTDTNTYADFTKRKYNALYFQVIDTLYDTVKLEILERDNAGGTDRIFAYFLPLTIECGTTLPDA